MDFDANFTNFEESNASDAEIVEFAKRDALYIVIPITIIYVIIFITGLVGNIATCIVIARNKSMHTATNYYLFSLAISDLLLLISGLPPEIYLIWSRYPYVFGYTFCVLRGLFAETSMNATVLTITAFTIERYVAICHPFLSHTMSKLSRVVKLILFIWTLAVCFAIPQATQFTLMKLYTDPDNDEVLCYVVNPIRFTFEISTFFFFVLPMTLIAVLYAMIAVQLKSSSMMKRSSTPPLDASHSNGANVGVNGQGSMRAKLNCRHQQSQSSRRVLKMLVAVVVAFFICWAPFHTQRLLATYLPSDTQSRIFDAVTYISGVLYFVSTTINPLLYNIMSNKFREAFKETFNRCCRAARFKSDPPRPQRSYSVLSRSAQRGGHESSDSYKDDHSLHTNSTVTTHRKESCDSIAMQQTNGGKRNMEILERHSYVSTGRNWPKDRVDVCLTMIPKTDLDIITPSTRLVAVKLSHPQPTSPSRIERVWRLLHCAERNPDGSFSSLNSTPAKDQAGRASLCSLASDECNKHRCDISNSSLRNVEMGELVDELSAYMEEIKTRELST